MVAELIPHIRPADGDLPGVYLRIQGSGRIGGDDKGDDVGPYALKAISGPYDPVTFLPTGGINAENLAPYLDFPKVLACGGTWIADASLVRQGRFGDIAAKARQAVAIARFSRQTPLSPQTPKGERP